jgi:transcription-repair coupling factor (superfamily II helicase)
MAVPAEVFDLPIPDPREGLPTIVVTQGGELDPEALVSFCIRWGYRRVETVEVAGEMARRGGIIDLFPPGLPAPVRIDLLGETVESLRRFDPESQRSVAAVPSVTVTPAEGEGIATTTLLSLWRPPLLVLSDHLAPLPESLSATRILFSPGAGGEIDLGGRPVAGWLPGPLRMAPRARGDGEPLLASLTAALREELPRGILLLARTERHREGLAALLTEEGVPVERLDRGASPVLVLGEDLPAGSVATVVAPLSSGVVLTAGPLVLTEEDLFGAKRTPSRRRRPSISPDELEIGDFIVHDDHGIGRFRGLVPLGTAGETGDFVLLEYAGGDRVYLPVTRLDGLARYVGPEEAPPAIDKLGGTRWRKARAKTREAAERLAGELLTLYAGREIARRPPFSPDGPWQREFEAAFEYVETDDQLRAIEEVKEDMEGGRPMDRLVCGDVGYGKTEVAMRAAFKAAVDGRQTAVLVPTTILAMQHLQTFRERMAHFPIRIESLSRFTPRSQVAPIKAAAAKGEIDILIGTHSILQKEVAFADLGLLVIDEEHRFGVRQKERIKQLRSRVDVLSLSATPIPRTLFMSLSGVRSLSLIDTPPEDRLPIATATLPFSDEVVVTTIRRELARGGQIFFVHNRIESLPAAEKHLRSILPEARIEAAHGKMDEEELERILWRFFRKEFDILLSTAIVESGLDIPTANTIIIDRADRFGLAQLYQLRGRVGRRGTQAYALLLVHPGDGLTDEARRRLEILQDTGAEGGGYRLATWDLELRGTGNLLGAAQSGQLEKVGLEHYTRTLRQAVARLRGEPPEIEPTIRIPGEAFLPEGYIPDPHHRLALYRRLSAASEGDLPQIRGELTDRFGPIPPPVAHLLEIVAVKGQARLLGIAALETEAGRIIVRWDPSTYPGDDAVKRWCALDPSVVALPPLAIALALTPRSGVTAVAACRRLLALLAAPPGPAYLTPHL